jgi:flagellar biosynthesis regulator FlbT
MDICTGVGEKVVFLDENGYDSDLKHARKFFIKGQELTVLQIDVHSSSSDVTFVGYPGQRFNTVMFANNTSTWERHHWFADSYMGVPRITAEQFDKMPFKESDMSETAIMSLYTHELVQDLVAVHHPDFEADLMAALTKSADESRTDDEDHTEPAEPVKNILMTLSRGSQMQLGFINPVSEEAVAEAFMNKFGYEHTSTHILYCGATFDPKHVSAYSQFCDC